ncbi:CALMODULIN LIKE 7, ROOT HAIR SPECIFIC 1 [Hibiscus trionum]|uniref:CALMODULIN LIKE 7, ROOT HAIR SPECIFIC 1 n=1 Tax=Hibiscus trionum TaxID=183268 RepID=A0A9W7H6K0_HIBTR|nr:CALMODULIN LIKE 7, ROOT HAIR SPECIFIC 1 [Hibiscus trionum]
MNGTELKKIFQMFDKNEDGTITKKELNDSELYQTIMDNKDEEEYMKEAFNVFDRNGDGYISVDELRSILKSLGLKQGKAMEDCKRMITKVDVDGNGGGFSAMA